ncbi:S-layer homology domain-containing protein [Paenibacillus hodogayensis]|uniref:S-layer homology domain-containing protein n=1 Tax=Paenibacillus hodogayensis TaxID=279208 RepID=A0ABV5VW46_9BACL
MNKYANKVAAMLIAAALGATSVPYAAVRVQAAEASPAAVAASISTSDTVIRAAIESLLRLGILDGYEDNSIRENQPVSRAELAKMTAMTFNLKHSANATALTDVDPNAWYRSYASDMVALELMQADSGRFEPQATVSGEELVQIVAKALKRDVMSVRHWLSGYGSPDRAVTRGEVALLLSQAHQAIPSAEARITSVKSLNAIALLVTFDAPLTADDELFAKAKEDFVFNDGLTLTNLPRLKTGSIASYIVPTSVQKPDVTYSLTYKGSPSGSFQGSSAKIDMTEARQVTNDTFQLESLRSAGVADYGYMIAAYSAGRGAYAFITDDNLSADGKTYQVISSMQARQVTITPQGGQPITAAYVPFTQSTDGRQLPKFRLPQGQTLTPGVSYTVTSDWSTIANPTFTAKTIEPLKLTSAKALGETSLQVSLAEDPGDELFAGRSVELTSPDGDKLSATYRYSSRAGTDGVFDVQQHGKLKAGTTYTVTPVGNWADGTATFSAP